MTAADIAAAVGDARREGRGWRSRYPLHGGRSLTLRDSDGGPLPVWCFGGCDPLSMYSPNGTGVDCARARHSALPRDRGPEGFSILVAVIATARVEKSEQAVARNSTGPPRSWRAGNFPRQGIASARKKETQMLDTSSQANFKPTAEIDDLDALAKEVCRHLAASTNAAQNFLEHAFTAAGDALIRAKKQVKPGNWYGWLRSCDLSEDKAQRYMQLAAHRAELDPARVRLFAPRCPETDRQATARQFQTEEKEGGHQLRRARVVVKRLSRSSIPLH